MGETQFMKDRRTLEEFVGPNPRGGYGSSMIDEDKIDAIRRVVSLAGALERELVEMVNQHCLRRDDGSIFAGAISANADAMRLLAELGVLKITGGGEGRAVGATRSVAGRCIYGEWDGWVKKEKP